MMFACLTLVARVKIYPKKALLEYVEDTDRRSPHVDTTAPSEWNVVAKYVLQYR